MDLAYVSAVAVANVRTVHGVCHQDVNKSVVEGSAVGLKDLEIGKRGIGGLMYGIEPGFLPAWFAVRLAVRNLRFDVPRPLQRFDVCAFGEG